MRTIFATIMLTALLALPAGVAGAVDIHPKAGTTSAAFLKLGVGSRATAMGSTYAAVADDATALYWNPAGLARLTRREIHLTHNESFENIKNDAACVAVPARSVVWGGAVYGLFIPRDLERRSGLNEDDPYEPLTASNGTFGAYDAAIQVGAARMVGPRLSLGAALKYIRQTIDDVWGAGVAADLGALYRAPGSPLSLGAAVQNAGTPIKLRETSYDLPLNIKAGAAWQCNARLLTAFDINVPNDNYPFVSTGAEYRLAAPLAVRLGYRYRIRGPELGDLAGASAGVGFSLPVGAVTCKIDYAFVPYGALGNSHRMSVAVLFGTGMRSAFTPEPAPPEPTVIVSTGAASIPAPVIAAAPAHIAPPAIPPPSQSEAAVYPSKVSVRLARTNGRASTYAMRIETPRSRLFDIQATVRVTGPRPWAAKILEQEGTGWELYRFSFRKSIRETIERPLCSIRLPLSVKEPVVIMRKGKLRLPLVRTGEEGADALYQCTLPTLEDFSIHAASR